MSPIRLSLLAALAVGFAIPASVPSFAFAPGIARIALNPQPLPPGFRKMINPQPLPPRAVR